MGDERLMAGRKVGWGDEKLYRGMRIWIRKGKIG